MTSDLGADIIEIFGARLESGLGIEFSEEEKNVFSPLTQNSIGSKVKWFKSKIKHLKRKGKHAKNKLKTKNISKNVF